MSTPSFGQGPGQARTGARNLTYREERFVETYLETGNATRAALAAGCPPASAGELGSRMLKRVEVQAALSHAKAGDREKAGVTREKVIEILAGMALARAADFVEVLKDPTNRENYVGLGAKEYAIEATKKSAKNGNEVKLISNAERRAALNDLWEKLDLGKTAGAKGWADGLDGLLSLVERVKSGRP